MTETTAAGQPGAGLTGRLTLVAASMRSAGARVGVGELLGAHRALHAVDPADRTTAYFALRASLCSRHEDLAAFDAAFALWLAAPRVQRAEPPAVLDEVASLVLPSVAVPGVEIPLREARDAEVVPAAWSDVELLRDKDFALYSADERRRARRVMRRLAASAPQRTSHRTRRARRRGTPPHAARPDLRRTLRASLRSDGDPIERHWRTPAPRPRRLVLVCDVSGSMAPYSRMLLQYVQAAVAAHRRVEAFAFGTRLTRITRELATRDPDRAIERAAAAVQDWSGGTRIGEALAVLNREHGRRLGRGAVVVVLSDGWDRGDPEVLAAEMARLRRCAHRVIWLNPLKAHPGYEPLARGMAAALPHADHFLAGSTLRSFEELADLLAGGMA
jgi:uncharacterized protein with von Willebrand factor type A (vWA) domain